MVVAVVAVRVVQVVVHQVVHVVAVRHRFVAAARPMSVPLLVPAASVVGRAIRRVRGADRQGVFLNLAAALVVQVAVVQVVRVVAVPQCRVAAAWPVLMVVAFVVR